MIIMHSTAGAASAFHGNAEQLAHPVRCLQAVAAWLPAHEPLRQPKVCHQPDDAQAEGHPPRSSGHQRQAHAVHCSTAFCGTVALALPCLHGTGQASMQAALRTSETRLVGNVGQGLTVLHKQNEQHNDNTAHLLHWLRC